MRICPTCQRTYPDDFSVCPRDGTPLTAQATATEAQLAAGLSRRFRIIRRLGQGGMGAVFLAQQITVGDRPVALKVLNRKLLDDPDFLMRFQNEAASTGRIRHSNVVTIYESGQADDGTPYIAMEFLEGESLGETLKQRGALPLPEVAQILQQAARGLNAAHKLGIIHRDLKPDNLFLTQGDEGEQMVKVVDFGIAKLRESSSHTQTGMVLGTPAYMSYEQASGMRSDELDARSDIYSLGVVAYEMLSGRIPFHSDTPVGYLRKHLMDQPPPFRAIAPGLGVPPAVEGAVMKALAKDRDQRYSSVLDFARAFNPTAPSTSEPVDLKALPSTKVAVLPAGPPEDRVPDSQSHDGKTIAEPNRPRSVAQTYQPRGVKKVLRPVIYVVSGLILLALIAAGIRISYPSGKVRLQTLPHAAVFLDDSNQGTTDWNGSFLLDMTAGSHDLWITAPGKKDYRRKITMQGGQDMLINAPLENTGSPPPLQSGANARDVLDRLETAKTQGDHFYDSGAYNDAINAYREGLKLDPSNAQLLQRPQARANRHHEQQKRNLINTQRRGRPIVPPATIFERDTRTSSSGFGYRALHRKCLRPDEEALQQRRHSIYVDT